LAEPKKSNYDKFDDKFDFKDVKNKLDDKFESRLDSKYDSYEFEDKKGKLIKFQLKF